ncbi:MAG: ABC transporter substrate-binding protein [Acidobacteriota bacterium]
MKRYSHALTAIILCVLIVMPGCNFFGSSRQHEVHPPKDPKVANCEPGRWGGRLKLPLVGAPLTFNPFLPATLETYEITSKLFGTLLDFDYVDQKFNNPADGLARSIDSLSDGRTFVVHLREGNSFSDGTPITADDVVFSFQAALDDRTDSVYGDLMRIDGQPPKFTKEDALSVRITFADHLEPVKYLFAKLPIVSKASLEPAFLKGNLKDAYSLETAPEKIVCSGPFVVKSYTPDKQIDLDYNKYYWKVDSSGTSLPYLDGVTYFLKTTREAQAHSMLTKGEFHAVQVLQKDIEMFKGNDRFIVRNQGPSLHTWQLVLNWRADPKKIDPSHATWFRTHGFRWALSSAVDRKRLANEVFNSLARPVYNQVTPSNTTWYHDAVKKYEHNPTKAHKYLADLKYQWTDAGILKDLGGRTVRFNITHLNEYVPTQIVQRLIEDFKKLGIQVESEPKEYKDFWKVLNLGIYDAILVESTPMLPDPAFLQPYLNKNGRFFWFYEVSAGDIALRGMVTSTEGWMDRVSKNMNEALKKLLLTERRDLYNQVQVDWAEKSPIIYLVNDDVVVAAQNVIGNFKPAVLDPTMTWNIEEFYLKN